MKVSMNNVLYVEMSINKWQDKVFRKARFVDDQGDYGSIEISVTEEQGTQLPAPKSRVDVIFDLEQRNKAVYLNNPICLVIPNASK